MNRYATLALTCAAVLLGTSPAWATSVPLDLNNPAPGSQIYQQTANRPCVIGDPSCSNGGFPFTKITESGGWSTFLDSPGYTVGQLKAALGGATQFWVGIDVNTAGATKDPPNADLADEHLVYFDVYINGGLAYDYTSPDPVNGTQLRIVNNGNGYSDDLLKTVDLTGLADATPVYFHALVVNASDGKEEFFLIPFAGITQFCVADCGQAVVPEPATMVLLGSGLVGAALALRRKARS